MLSRFIDLSAIRSVFSNRNYAIYASGNAISLIGMWVKRLAVGWLAWELSHSGFWLGAVAAADLLPAFAISPFGGVLADRFDRIRIILVSQLILFVQVASVMVLILADFMTVEILFGLTLIHGIVSAVVQPARLAVIPSLVKPKDLTGAVAVNSVIFNLARFVGPLVAGFLIASVGIASTFGVNAATFLVMFVTLLFVKLEEEETPASRRRGVFADIGEGVTYAATHPAIAPFMFIMITSTILARPIFELLPGFADAIFAQGPQGLATLTAATGVGAIIAGVIMAQRGELRGLTTISLVTSVLSALITILFASTNIFLIGVLAMALLGATTTISGVSSQTLVQSALTVNMRGRVMSLWGMIFRGGPAIGALGMGWLSNRLGLQPPLIVGSALAAVAALYAFRWRGRMIAIFESDQTAEGIVAEATAEMTPVSAAAETGEHRPAAQ